VSVEALLTRSRHLWVAANRRDGPPHVTPLWFVCVEQKLWMSITLRARKAALIRADPRVSVAVDGTSASGGLVGEGAAVLVDVAARPDVIAALADKYGGWDAADPAPEGPRTLIAIELRRWLLTPST
jgi:hypothetical protein